jgi:hypothetical protein
MKIVRPLLFIFSILSFQLHAQFKCFLGWNEGHGTPYELNREIYIYNDINGPYLTKQMKEIHWNQGPAVGFRAGGDLYFEMQYSRKSATVSSHFDSASVPMTRELKIYHNTFNYGMGGRIDGWNFGLSLDFGRFMGKGKRGPDSGIKNQDWQRFWILPHQFLGALGRLFPNSATAFVEYDLDFEHTFIGLRAYAQFDYTKSGMSGLDHWLFGNNLNFQVDNGDRMNSFGIAIYAGFNKK